MLFGGCVTILAIACIVIERFRDPIAELKHFHATELSPDANRQRWYAQSAKCLGIDTTYDLKLRYFTGAKIPASWQPASGTFIGYTSPADHLILLATSWAHDSTLIVHEQLHDRFGGGHPQRLFSGRCGVYPGQDR